MKQRPNISLQNKIDRKLDYFKYLAEENIQPNVSANKTFNAHSKTKNKPNIKLENRNLDRINKHRIDMLNYANREYAINPDLLITYFDKYVLTITSYTLLFHNETPTAKDFDIYCDGLLIDKETYSVDSKENIIITIQKHEAVDDEFDTINFEIVSKWDWKQLNVGDINNDGEEDWLDTEDYKDIILN